VARTIADLDAQLGRDPVQMIEEAHVAEALRMRAQIHARLPEIA
jgi:predicted ATPase with chaperone activity